ncbi:DUF5615 family PIN-like protein [Candidatus Roizmanbacteria bacterium]|nr:DUF5615 family PIN-like protein [Candidatus Roizmanbacteria bacterium]
MKLLLDQNISRKLVNELEDLFPGSSHVHLLDLQRFYPTREVGFFTIFALDKGYGSLYNHFS